MPEVTGQHTIDYKFVVDTDIARDILSVHNDIEELDDNDFVEWLMDYVMGHEGTWEYLKTIGELPDWLVHFSTNERVTTPQDLTD